MVFLTQFISLHATPAASIDENCTMHIKISKMLFVTIYHDLLQVQLKHQSQAGEFKHEGQQQH